MLQSSAYKSPGNSSSRTTVGRLLIVIAACCGCGESLPVASVSGTILFDGKPLVDASITTQPVATKDVPNPGPGSFGRTDADGKYELELVEPAVQGAIVGIHRVTITRAPKTEEDPWSDAPRAPRDRSWPRQYTDGSLSLEVPAEGRTDADFSLTASGS